MMEERNTDFIIKNDGYCCPICGKDELVLSTVKLFANYGSKEHDGEIITFHVCGDCIDRLFNLAEDALKEDDYQTEYTLQL